MKIIRKLFMAMIIMGIMLLSPYVFAEETGSIRFALPKEYEEVEISLYHVGDYDGTKFVLADAFAKSNVTIPSLDSSENTRTANVLAEFAKQNSIAPVASGMNVNGEIAFENIGLHLYLAMQTKGTDVIQMDNLLVAIPCEAEDPYNISLRVKYQILNGAFILRKTDETGTNLSGVVFDLYKKKYLSKGATLPEGSEKGGYDGETGLEWYWDLALANLTTGTDGKISVRSLSLGTYKMKEREVPAGFVNEPVSKIIELKTSIQTGDTIPQYTVTNPRITLVVNKVNEKGEAVTGATLTIKDKNGNVLKDENGNPKYEFVTTKEAKEIKGIPAGEYYLSEIKTPEGYQTAEDVLFTVSDEKNAENTVTMVDKKTKTEPAKRETESGKNNKSSKTSSSTKSSSQVKTGDETPIAMLVVLLIGSAIVIFKSRKYTS